MIIAVKAACNLLQEQTAYQTFFSALDEQVSADNPVRLIYAFVDKLNLEKLGFGELVYKNEGRPPYAPQVLLKLYLYGYLNRIRSSRKLEKECCRNIGLQWLLQGLTPNYHTIADFRSFNVEVERSRNQWVKFWCAGFGYAQPAHHYNAL